jgi:hypothetical protein
MRRTTSKTETRKMIEDMLEMMTKEEVESLRRIMTAMIGSRRSFSENKQKEK